MEDDHKIRAKAHELWEAEGCPEGKADRHWTEAREIITLREGGADTARTPLEETIGEPVEPAAIAEKHGETPVLTDLGDEGGTPSRAKAAEIADTRTPGGRGRTAR